MKAFDCLPHGALLAQHHAAAVVRFGKLRAQRDRPLEREQRGIELLEAAQQAAEIVVRLDQLSLFDRALEARARFLDEAFVEEQPPTLL